MLFPFFGWDLVYVIPRSKLVRLFIRKEIIRVFLYKIYIRIFIIKKKKKNTYYHFFVVDEVHFLSPCPRSQGVPCNYHLFDPSSSAMCQVYCPSHSSLYASHQDCVTTCDPPNKVRWKIYSSSFNHSGLPPLSFFYCKQVDISFPNNVQLNVQYPE